MILFNWISLLQDGVFVVNRTEPFLTLEAVKPSDRGSYHCIATNNIGSSNQSRSGLLAIDGTYAIHHSHRCQMLCIAVGIFQYLVKFSCVEEYNFTDLVIQVKFLDSSIYVCI